MWVRGYPGIIPLKQANGQTDPNRRQLANSTMTEIVCDNNYHNDSDNYAATHGGENTTH